MNLNTYKHEMSDYLNKIDSDSIDVNVFNKVGIAIVRNAVPKNVVSNWYENWRTFAQEAYGEDRIIENQFNPVEIKKQLPVTLTELSKNEHLLKHAKTVFGEELGLYQRRFVVKDEVACGPVLLHQDTCYHVGTGKKASLFLALTHANVDNGGLTYYLGTCGFGNLGDAGQINRTVLPDDWPTVTPSLAPGDFVLMDSRTWHESGPYLSGGERVLTDFIYQDSRDPSTIEIVNGSNGWDDEFLVKNRSKLFTQSRSLKLKSIKEILDSTTKK